MNGWVLAAAMVAALNPPARAARLRHLDRPRAALAAVAVVVAVIGLAALAEPLRSAADVSAPNLRVAAGLVLTATSVVDLVRRPGPPLDLGAGWWAALVPVAFPVLLEPQVGVVALSAGADRPLWAPAAAAALAASLWVASTGLATAVLWPLTRAVGALGVLAGTALVVDGVLSV